MKRKERPLAQVKIIYVVTTIFLVALSVYTFVHIDNQTESFKLLNHTNLVHQTLQKISVAAVEAETSKRGFLLSGDSAQLDRRDHALSALDTHQHLLDSLIKNDPAQIHHLKKLQEAIYAKTVSTRNVPDGQKPFQIDLLLKENTAAGIQKMDSVRKYVSKMTLEEQNLLSIRDQKYKRLSFLTPVFIVALFLGALLILFVSYFRLNKTITQSYQLQKELKNLVTEAPVAICLLRGPDHVFELANDVYIKIRGRKDILGKPMRQVFPELQEMGWFDMLDAVYQTGEPAYRKEIALKVRNENGQVRDGFFNFHFRATFEEKSGNIDGIIGNAVEVTELVNARKKVEESEKSYNQMLMFSPFAFAVFKGEAFVIELANDSMKEIWGKGPDVEGKKILELLPEIQGQPFPELLQKVYKTGIPYNGYEMLAQLEKNGKLEDVFLNFVYQPYYEAGGTISGITIIAIDVTNEVVSKKKVEATEKRFREMVAKAPVAISVLRGADFVVEVANEQMLKQWGKSEEQMLHKPVFEAMPDAKGQAFEQLLTQVYETGKSFSTDELPVNLIRNGISEDLYLNFVFEPLYNCAGQIDGVIVVATEITAQVLARKKTEESEEQFSTLANNIQNLAWMADGEGHIFWYNERWYEYTGLSRDDRESEDWQKIHHPEHIDRVMDITNRAWKLNEPFEITFPIKSASGEYKWFLTRAYPVSNSDGEITRWIGTSTDINEHKNAEEQFRTLADSAPVLIWMSGQDKLCHFFNKTWLNFTGRTIEQEAGNGWTAGVHPDDLQRCLDIYITAFDKREEFYMEYRLRRHDEGYRWISNNGVPRYNSNGAFDGYTGACMDIHNQLIYQHRIKENEEKLNIVIQASELGIWELNLKTSDIIYSDRYIELYGYKERHELTYAQLIDHLHPDDLKVRKAAFKEAEKTGFLQYETRVIWNDKSIHWLQGKGKVFYDEEHVPELIIGTIRDITDEKRHHQELEEREQKFRLLADSMPQHIWTSDTKGNLNYFNQSVFDYSGLTAEQIEQDGWLQIVHSDDRPENIRTWTNAISTGKDFLLEHRFRRYDGEYRWQLSRAIPQKDDEGNIQMWVGTSTDIHDQKTFASELERQVRNRTNELKQLNDALIKSEERYHLMVEEVQDYAIIYLNLEGIIENWNKGAEKIKGYPPEHIIGQSFVTFYTEEDLKTNLPFRLLAEAREHGKAANEGWRVRKDGKLFWAHVVITAVHNDQGEIIGFSKVTHDLTEKKKADDQIRITAQQLLQNNENLEKVNKELELFTHISSHDLQEPLRKIQLSSSRILDKDFNVLSDTGKEHFKRVMDAAVTMQTLIEDLQTYSRSNTKEGEFEITDLNMIVDEVCDGLRDIIEEKNAIIEAKDLCEVFIIPFQFRQLMQNLIGNALKFSKPQESPHILIKSCTLNGNEIPHDKLLPDVNYCHIVVRDNGIGFEPQYAEKIFEVFQRLHGKEKYKGTGIGLAIVKKIVENHNGIIIASGELNKGACFDIYLPTS